MTKPFDKYPEEGERFLPKATIDNTRHGYGLKLQSLTGQTNCAYCDLDLVDNFYHWLLMSVDHVIPAGECRRLNMPAEWRDSYSNLVICCSGCNGWDNRYRITETEPIDDWTPVRFFALRNSVFQQRKERILNRRAEEVAFFQSSPWAV